MPAGEVFTTVLPSSPGGWLDATSLWPTCHIRGPLWEALDLRQHRTHGLKAGTAGSRREPRPPQALQTGTPHTQGRFTSRPPSRPQAGRRLRPPTLANTAIRTCSTTSPAFATTRTALRGRRPRLLRRLLRFRRGPCLRRLRLPPTLALPGPTPWPERSNAGATTEPMGHRTRFRTPAILYHTAFGKEHHSNAPSTSRYGLGPRPQQHPRDMGRRLDFIVAGTEQDISCSDANHRRRAQCPVGGGGRGRRQRRRKRACPSTSTYTPFPPNPHHHRRGGLTGPSDGQSLLLLFLGIGIALHSSDYIYQPRPQVYAQHSPWAGAQRHGTQPRVGGEPDSTTSATSKTKTTTRLTRRRLPAAMQAMTTPPTAPRAAFPIRTTRVDDTCNIDSRPTDTTTPTTLARPTQASSANHEKFEHRYDQGHNARNAPERIHMEKEFHTPTDTTTPTTLATSTYAPPTDNDKFRVQLRPRTQRTQRARAHAHRGGVPYTHRHHHARDPCINRHTVQNKRELRVRLRPRTHRTLAHPCREGVVHDYSPHMAGKVRRRANASEAEPTRSGALRQGESRRTWGTTR